MSQKDPNARLPPNLTEKREHVRRLLVREWQKRHPDSLPSDDPDKLKTPVHPSEAWIIEAYLRLVMENEDHE